MGYIFWIIITICLTICYLVDRYFEYKENIAKQYKLKKEESK